MSERVAFLDRPAGVAVDRERAPPIGQIGARTEDAWRTLVEDPPWPALASARGLVAWSNTDRAAHEAEKRGLPLWGAKPHVVDRFDRVWLTATARSADPECADVVTVLSVNEMSTAAIEAVVERWPPFARARFSLTVLRPRAPVEDVSVFGRRARFRFDNPEGLSVFRNGAGAVLALAPAPIARVHSAWLVDDHGEPHVCGLVRADPAHVVDDDAAAHVDAAGAYGPGGALAYSAVRTSSGHVVAGTRFDEDILERARVVVERACANGLRGACAVTAVVFRGDPGDVHASGSAGGGGGISVSDVVVRGAAGFHAGFTIGHVAAGQLSRALDVDGARLRYVVASDDVVDASSLDDEGAASGDG